MAKEQLRGLAKTVQLRIPFARLLWIALAVCGSLTNGLFVHLKMIFFIRADLNAFYHAIGIAGHKGNGPETVIVQADCAGEFHNLFDFGIIPGHQLVMQVFPYILRLGIIEAKVIVEASRTVHNIAVQANNQ